MGKTYDVRIWSVRQRKDRGQTSAELRWKTGETPHSQTFRTKTLAEGLRAELLRAAHGGEPFDESTGVPLSELRQRNDVSWYQHAREYIEMKWQHSPGSTRRTLAEAMATVTPALDADRLTDSPLPQVQWKAPEQVAEELDPASVPDPRQAAALLDAVRTQSPRGRRLVAFFGCMYYAAARPAEVIGLRLQDCELPRRGWGTLRLRETRPRSGSAWTDSGEAHDRRGLKHRPRKAVRPVPIPPDLVSLLRWHVTAYGVAPDGRPDTARCGRKPAHGLSPPLNARRN